MLTLNALTSILIPYLIGLSIFLLLKRTHTLPALMIHSLSYAIGIGAIAIWMFILGIFHIPFSTISIIIPVIIILVLGRLKRKRGTTPIKLKIDILNHHKKYNIIFLLMALAILSQIIYVFFLSFYFPIYAWDAFATIAYKAKIFFYDAGIQHLPNTPHSGYPLLVPLLESWVAINLGAWDNGLIKIIFPFTYLAFLSLIYSFLRTHTSRNWSAFGCLIASMSIFFTFHATIAYTDFIMSFYVTAALILLLKLKDGRPSPDYFLAGLITGIGTFVKSEGLLYAGILGIIVIYLLIATKKSWKDTIQKLFNFSLPVIFIGIGYKAYTIFLNLNFDFRFDVQIPEDWILRVFLTSASIFNNLFLSWNWNITWLMFLFILMKSAPIAKNLTVRLLSISIGLHFLILLTISSFTGSFIYIGGSGSNKVLSRLILHFFPQAVLFVILAYSEIFKKLNESITQRSVA